MTPRSKAKKPRRRDLEIEAAHTRGWNDHIICMKMRGAAAKMKSGEIIFDSIYIVSDSELSAQMLKEPVVSRKGARK